MNNFTLEELTHYNLNKLLSGVDEAGRGCLAGPVCAASVIIPKNFNISILDDSKKLTPYQRNTAYNEIVKNSISFAYEMTFEDEIDEINILQATVKSMHNSIKKMKIQPEFLLIDGNYFKDCGIDYKTMVRGDSLSPVIAAASIIAKVSRDKWMLETAHKLYPEYGFDRHKGYATKSHFEAIKNFGILPIHRKTFLKKYFLKQLSLF
jgi:ribonuclease HII